MRRVEQTRLRELLPNLPNYNDIQLIIHGGKDAGVYKMAFNEKHNIVPQTIIKEIKNTLDFANKEQKTEIKDVKEEIERLKGLMAVASKQLDFETAITLRDKISELKKQIK